MASVSTMDPCGVDQGEFLLILTGSLLLAISVWSFRQIYLQIVIECKYTPDVMIQWKKKSRPWWLRPCWESQDGKLTIHDKYKFNDYILSSFIRNVSTFPIPNDLQRIIIQKYCICNQNQINLSKSLFKQIDRIIDTNMAPSDIIRFIEGDIIKKSLSSKYKMDLQKYCKATRFMHRKVTELFKTIFNVFLSSISLFCGIYVTLIMDTNECNIQSCDENMIWYMIITLGLQYQRIMVLPNNKRRYYFNWRSIMMIIMIWSVYISGLMRTGTIAIFIYDTTSILLEAGKILKYTHCHYHYFDVSFAGFVGFIFVVYCFKVMIYFQKVISPMFGSEDWGNLNIFCVTLSKVSLIIIGLLELHRLFSICKTLIRMIVRTVLK